MSVTEEEFRQYLSRPIDFPPSFKDWVSDWFAVNVPKLHVSQIYGFKLQSIKSATEITNLLTVSSTAYSALSPDGPSITSIPNGYYLAFFGATFGTTAGAPFYNNAVNVYMAPVVDSGAASDSEAAILNGGSNGRVTFLDMTGGDNDHTITFQYKRTGSSNVGIWNRWLYLLKVVTED